MHHTSIELQDGNLTFNKRTLLDQFRQMKRALLGISLKDRIGNSDIRKNTGFKDIVARITEKKKKWIWTVYIARLTDRRWTKEVLNWQP